MTLYMLGRWIRILLLFGLGYLIGSFGLPILGFRGSPNDLTIISTITGLFLALLGRRYA